ncbi:MAG: peptidoglycan recognition family protein [Lachnospiraceae bacterium]|nr:peptidoglycan recognition family protein [Lachnospiraceae bacterium]
MRRLTKAKKRKLKRRLIFIAAFLATVLAVSNIAAWFIKNTRNVPGGKTEKGFDYSLYNVKQPSVRKMLLTENVNSRPGTELKKVNGIVIHYTANPDTDAEANRNYFEGRKDEPDENANKVSSHYIIGLDGTIIQCIPLNEIAYASNDRNADTISIECCHPDETGRFSDDTYNSLIHLSAWLCGKYQLSRDSVIRHYDVTGKMCPLYYVDNGKAWDKLKGDIWNYFLDCKKTENTDKD